jgi:hypothetical protein
MAAAAGRGGLRPPNPPPFEALCINPYTRTATVVQLSAPAAAAAPDAPYRIAARANCVPDQHWPLFAALVHTGRTDAYAHGFFQQTLILGVRQAYTHVEHRGVLWLRADVPDAGTPERDEVPGFALLDGAHPGVWWAGCAFLALYERHGTQPVAGRGFLETTARAAVSWARVPEVEQLTRVRITAATEGAPVLCETVPSCARCGLKLDERPKRCGACQRVYYCTKGCQKAHWRLHKALCDAARA